MSPVVTIAAVSENTQKMLREAHLLFYSLRSFGGALSQANAILYVVDSMPTETSSFEKLGVELKQVATIDPRSPHSNKIHMLLDKYDTDWLVAMDIDTVITGDFTMHLREPVVSAKIVDGNPLSEELWHRLYGYFDLTLPSERYLSHFHARDSNPYFNSGVLLIPGAQRAVLGVAWLELVTEVMAIYALEPEIAKQAFFTDQFAFALALTKTGLAYRTLPLEMNFPTHMPVHPMFVPDDFCPLVLHHHHKISALGKLEHCDYPVVNTLIDRINRSLDADEYVSHGLCR